MHKSITTAVFLMLTLAASPDIALARGGEDPAFRAGGTKIDLHRRFPGDRSLDGGNVRIKGPDKGVYIERCTWYARETFLGLPWGFTQRCVRHTLENTK